MENFEKLTKKELYDRLNELKDLSACLERKKAPSLYRERVIAKIEKIRSILA